MTSINSRDWYIQAALLESELDTTVGAGRFQFGAEARLTAPVPSDAETVSVFGRFVELMRRKRGLSVEKLAIEADVDIAELVEIEEDIHTRPEPRTVYQLARFFRVPEAGLLQIAGLTSARDSSLVHESVRFAARSNPVNALSAEERSALEAFVAELDKQS